MNNIAINLSHYIKENYFRLLSEDGLADLYSDNAIIYFGKEEFHGKDEVESFANKIKSFSFRANGRNVQLIPKSETWVVLTIVGTVKTDSMHYFCSVMDIEINEDNKTALIQYQNFTIL